MHYLQEQSSLSCKKMSDIDNLRNKMEEVTLEMIKLLKTRTEIAKEIGEVKKNKVNVSMITQGSSELNLAFVVKNSDTNAAVRALHDAFALDKIN